MDSVTYYIHDHLGNTRVTYQPEAVCSVDGNLHHVDYFVDAVVDYYPYGKVLRLYDKGGDNHLKEKYLSTHHERDFETSTNGIDFAGGWDYRGARYYDSDIGRFLSVDPLAHILPAWSPYAFVYNNPINFIDPIGMIGESTHTDEDGNVLAVYDDGDLGVYKHTNGTTKEDLDKKHGVMVLQNPTGAGGEKMGETAYWDEFVDPDQSGGDAVDRIIIGALLSLIFIIRNERQGTIFY